MFDNLVLLKSVPGYALMEPVPLKARAVPPVVPDKVDLARKDAVVYMTDIYSGPGLKGVPRGTVKRLRLLTYQFAYHGMGGQVNRVGLDGPWDVKRIVGTVPVEPDGSAYFRIPANTPIAVQPLDADGQALQLMRSWMTAMPGEALSCVGCHDRQSMSPASGPIAAMRREPAEITPWCGPARLRVQARGAAGARRLLRRVPQRRRAQDGRALPDFTVRAEVHPGGKDPNYTQNTKFSPSYIALRSYVRGHTIESDMHLLEPCEYHAGTTELVQVLRKGHYGVALDAEAWDRLYTWIDLNTPYHGSWREIIGDARVNAQRARRLAMNRQYAALDEDPEADADLPAAILKAAPRAPEAAVQAPAPPACPGWPFDEAEAKRRQAAGGPAERKIDLGPGLAIDLVRIPEGEFVMGDAAGFPDEKPLTRVRVAKAFWMGKCEVTNEQFAAFDPTHDSRIDAATSCTSASRSAGIR